MTFQEWFVTRLETEGLNPHSFAELVHVAPTTVYSWVRGSQPGLGYCKIIAEALHEDAAHVREIAGHDIGDVEPQEFTSEEARWVRILRTTAPGVRHALLEAARLAPPPRQGEGESGPPVDDPDPGEAPSKS